MEENRAVNLLAPSVLAQPRHADERVTFDRAVLLIRVALVIHVVQQADGFPKIDICAAQLREMFHRISDRVAMFSQAFRLDPFVENRESVGGKGHLKIFWFNSLQTLNKELFDAHGHGIWADQMFDARFAEPGFAHPRSTVGASVIEAARSLD